MESKITRLNKALAGSSAVMVNNKYFAPWLSLLYVCIYTVYGGVQIFNNEILLGEFLTNVAIFKSVGDSWGVIYNVLLEMQQTFPKLMHLVKYMNLETDVLARKAVFES